MPVILAHKEEGEFQVQGPSRQYVTWTETMAKRNKNPKGWAKDLVVSGICGFMKMISYFMFFLLCIVHCGVLLILFCLFYFAIIVCSSGRSSYQIEGLCPLAVLSATKLQIQLQLRRNQGHCFYSQPVDRDTWGGRFWTTLSQRLPKTIRKHRNLHYES